MPATSAKQKKFMDAAAHNPAFAKEAGIPVGVAQEFSEASKGKKFRRFGGDSRPDLQKVGKPKTDHGKMNLFKEGGNVKKIFGGKETRAEEMKEAKALKSGKISPAQYVKGEKSEGHGGGAASKAKAIKSGAISPAKYGAEHAKKMARGGGIESKGKTKGTMIKMKSGGKMC